MQAFASGFCYFPLFRLFIFHLTFPGLEATTGYSHGKPFITRQMYQVHCILLFFSRCCFFFLDDILISLDKRFYFCFLGSIATIIYTKVMAYCISSPWFYHVQDPGPLKCRDRNDKFRKLCRIVVDDRIVDIVKRVGLEGLYRTSCVEIDHNLITAFIE